MPGVAAGEAAFQRGMKAGREAAEIALRRIAAWSEEHPGQMVLAGLALGFVLGKLLLGRPRPVTATRDQVRTKGGRGPHARPG